MRVVMISKALVVGAYQRKLEELAALPGVELTAIVPPAWRDRRGVVALERAYTRNYDLIVAPLVFNGQYHVHFYPTIGRLLKHLRPDIVHADEEPYNLATWQTLRIGRSLGARGVFFTWQNLTRRYPWPFSYFERVNFRRAEHAIAGNVAAVEVLRSKGYAGPVSVIPQFGVDPGIFSPLADGSIARMPDRPEGGLTIGYVGGLVPEKGVDILLRACVALPDPHWNLLIVGDGPDRARLAALAAALPGAQSRVRFLGYRSSVETPAVYRQLDVLVLPSLSRPNWVEQFGRVLVEAMACGVPVIGSSCGEIPNVIGEAGIVCPEGDIEALSAALAALAADPGRRSSLAHMGRARVLAHFTQAQVASATYRVYQQMLGTGE